MYNYINTYSYTYTVLKLSQNSSTNTRTVTDVTDKLLMEEIVQNAANAKRVTEKLCRQLSEIEDILEDIVEKNDLTDDLEEFDFRGFGLRYCGSRLAEYIHIVYLDSMSLLPSAASQVGKGFYYHGDFNCWYDYMYRELVIDFAHCLKEFLQNFNGKLVELAKQAEIEIPKISIS